MLCDSEQAGWLSSDFLSLSPDVEFGTFKKKSPMHQLHILNI